MNTAGRTGGQSSHPMFIKELREIEGKAGWAVDPDPDPVVAADVLGPYVEGTEGDDVVELDVFEAAFAASQGVDRMEGS